MQNTPSKGYQQLQPEDLVTLASLVQQNFGVREMALIMGRSTGTISIELRRKAPPARYASATACPCAQQRRTQSRPLNKSHRDGAPFAAMRRVLSQR